MVGPLEYWDSNGIALLVVIVYTNSAGFKG